VNVALGLRNLGTYRSGDVALTWASARELHLDILLGQVESLLVSSGVPLCRRSTYGRDTIDDTPDRLAVALAVGVDPEELAERRHFD
jgi:hypothetical protein